MSNAKILSISRLRFGVDGKGIRTLIGFMGCPLRCKYCINSSSWDGTYTGKSYSVTELFDKVKIDNLYFLASGGGITFGGGEPLLHSDFIKEFIKIAPSEWSFNIETSLSVPFNKIECLTDLIDLFIVDIKSMDSEIYSSYTGGSLNLIKDNLLNLIDLVGADKILVRVPIIEGFSDSASQEKSINELKKLGITKIDRLTYITK